MCSIIGYLGNTAASHLLVKGLKRMEYRGYDSVGIAISNNDKIEVRKGVGKVAEVEATQSLQALDGHVGIGHTRWATHGEVTSKNAHPHKSSTGQVAIVHNGIIDNYVELRQKLQSVGYTFMSETDSEAISNMLQLVYDRTKDVKVSMMETVAALKGEYSFVAIFEDGTLAAARFHEPLVIGLGKTGYFVSSDVLGFAEHTDEVIYPDNGEIIVIGSNGLQFFDFSGNPMRHHITKVSKEFADAYKGDYAHFTLKEINDQPESMVKAGENHLNEMDKIVGLLRTSKTAYLTGSGTSYHAALVAKHIFLKYGKLRIEPIISSESRFYPDYFDEQSVVIALSQSGESADVMETVRIARSRGSKVASIVNIMTSSLVQESLHSVGLNCGPEIGVAATKSFTSQLSILYKMCARLSTDFNLPDFAEISGHMVETIASQRQIQEIARELKNASDIYVLGRGIHYPIALEAALKIKELAYIHAEGLPGGELKHGPLALVDSNVYVIVLNPSDSTHLDTLSSAHEIKARKAKVIGISDKQSDIYDHWIRIPHVAEPLSPFLEIVPIQLLAYFAAIEKDADPDYPRNLAKSVTVK